MDGLAWALRELAREAQPEASATPDDLWRQGRQRVRRRRAIGGVVAAVVVVLAGVASLLVPAPTVVMPAGTDDEGPLGHLAVLGRTRDDRAFGISAITGEYRYLDLPGRVRDLVPTLVTVAT